MAMHISDSLVFEELGKRDHEQVVFCRDEACGLQAIIGIHSTELGPALGGCRMFPYHSERDALQDVLRLARGMTYKAAISGLNLGGGKAVVIGHPKKPKSELLWRALGRFIECLSGRYITAEDAGTTMEDMELIRMETKHVVGIARALGGSGDPSPVTALGVFSGMRATVEEELDRSTLEGLKVAVQGCGHVGYHLVGHLVRAGAEVTVNEMEGYNRERALGQATRIYDVLRAVLERAKSDNLPTYRAANNLAMERIDALNRVRRTYTGSSRHFPACA